VLNFLLAKKHIAIDEKYIISNLIISITL
jgi:hypothetical protein